MPKIYNVGWPQFFEMLSLIDQKGTKVYGIPKGGMIAAGFLRKAMIVHDPGRADLILDDLIDSGATMQKYQDLYPHTPTHALINKKRDGIDAWVIFPWERDHPNGEENIQENIVRQLQYIGEDPKREGLSKTPDRVVRSWTEMFSGYKQNPADIFTMFEPDGYDQIVLLKDIEVFSTCEHHLLPFFGVAHIAYIPNKKVIGISKLARLMDIFARRLQIQERLGEQITQALMKYLEPIGAACIIEATHLCMRMRGVQKQHSTMTTSSLKGSFLDKPAAREELLQLIRGK